MPGANTNASQVITNVPYGSIYQATVGLTPLVFEPTRYIISGTGQVDMVGNKRMLHSMNLQMVFRVLENQATHDEVNIRFSVLRLKQRLALPTAGVNTTTYTRALYLTGATTTSGANPSVSQFTTLPWDRSKVKVMYDKVKRIHGTPMTVSAQLNVQFKQQVFSFRKRWPKGLMISYDPTIEVNGSLLSQTQDPIVVIAQMMEAVTTGPATQTMTFAPGTDSYLSLTWRDM